MNKLHQPLISVEQTEKYAAEYFPMSHGESWVPAQLKDLFQQHETLQLSEILFACVVNHDVATVLCPDLGDPMVFSYEYKSKSWTRATALLTMIRKFNGDSKKNIFQGRAVTQAFESGNMNMDSFHRRRCSVIASVLMHLCDCIFKNSINLGQFTACMLPSYISCVFNILFQITPFVIRTHYLQDAYGRQE
eukprot:m.133815 g.133815  ORF g.133815 m.133815 type:complete len:191 (-) comp14680_c0_seq5:2785-3357(-)